MIRTVLDSCARWLRALLPSRGSRGSITPFALIVTIALLALGGLVIDGGRQLNAKGRAVAYAQEAARAGAQAINLLNQDAELVPDDAVRAARAFCDEAMARDDRLVSCTPSITESENERGNVASIAISTRVETKPILLSMFGRGAMTSSGAAVAQPITGISEAAGDDEITLPPPSVALPGDPGLTTAPPGSITTPPSEEVPTCATETTTPPPDEDDPKPPTKTPKPPDDSESPEVPTCVTSPPPGAQ